MTPRRSAFTLLEVLVALAIFAMAAVVLGGSYLNVLNGYEVARRATVSNPDVAFARTALLAQADVDLARQGAEFDAADGRHVRWTATIDPTTVADLFTVTFECEISGTGLSEPQKTKQVFRVLRPTWSQATDRTTLRANAKDRILQIQQKVNQ
ncbi:MAG: prepilin-type N-terminal cleavage/methylation domain-containing protein [Opitutaceae bacterium]|jgi:general secretion pathway protein I